MLFFDALHALQSTDLRSVFGSRGDTFDWLLEDITKVSDTSEHFEVPMYDDLNKVGLRIP